MRIIISLAILFNLFTASVASATQQDKNEGIPIRLTLYSLLGTSFYQLNKVNESEPFQSAQNEIMTLNLGAGFFSQIGDHFAYGADYLYGSHSSGNSYRQIDTRIMESPFFVQYKVLSWKGHSIAPQIGFTIGSMQISSYDKKLDLNNSTVITRNYFTGRIGVSFNFTLSDGLYIGLKSGYNFPFSNEDNWKVVGSGMDYGMKDNAGQFYLNLVIGTTVVLL